MRLGPIDAETERLDAELSQVRARDLVKHYARAIQRLSGHLVRAGELRDEALDAAIDEALAWKGP